MGGCCTWLDFLVRTFRTWHLCNTIHLITIQDEGIPGIPGHRNFSNPTIDASFASTIQIFRNLVSLCVQVDCHDEGDHGLCVFKLNNDDVNKLAMALPQLEWLLLGDPCGENTCATTIACLLLLSVHCVELQWLKIHFNTTNIADDLRDISADPRFEELRLLPRGRLSYLDVWQTPLSVNEPDFEAVVNGIIPSLERCDASPYNLDWEEVSDRMEELPRTRMLPVYCP